MSSRQPPKQPGRSASKESLRKQPEKQPTTRKTSADRGGHSGRVGTASLPSSPLNPKPTPGPSTKKPGSSVTPRKEALVTKAKVGKPFQKEHGVSEVPIEDLPVDVEVHVEAGEVMQQEEVPFRRLPRGVETGQFVRRTPAAVKPVAFRPELSPRSQKVHNSACRFLAVKREESNDQRRMETCIMELFPRMQRQLTRVNELSHRARSFPPNPPQTGDDAVRAENDTLNAQIAMAGTIFRELDSILSESKLRINEFIGRAERGTRDIDEALREVVNDIIYYSKTAKDTDIRPPEGPLGGHDGGKPDDGDDRGDGSGGKPGDGGDKGDGPDGGSGGEKGGKPGDGSDGKPGAGSGGDQGSKPGDGPDGKPEGGSGGGQRDGGDRDGSGYGSGGDHGGDQGDKPEDSQGGKPEGSADDDKQHTDDLGQGYLGDDDYDSVISPSASESEPEFDEDIYEDDETSYREVLEAVVPTLLKVGEGVKVAIQNPETAPEVHKFLTKTAESSSGQFKGIFKGGIPGKLVDSLSGLDPENPEKALEYMIKKLVDALGYLGPITAESSLVEGIEGLMRAATTRLEEVPKDTVSSETKLNPDVSKDGQIGVSTDDVTSVDL